MRYFLLLRKCSTSAPKSISFIEEMQTNFIPLNAFQKTLLTCGSAAISLLNPNRGDMIACLGEVTGEGALQYMQKKIQETDEGVGILKEMPRINSKTVSFDKLSAMPENTLGRVYADFMRDNNITADSRLPVQFIADPQLAYVMQRYREVHDLVHAVLFMKTTMLGEVAVKWVEGIQTKLPMCVSGGIWGAGRLKPKHRQLYLKHYLPWAIRTGHNARFMQGVNANSVWLLSRPPGHCESYDFISFKIRAVATEGGRPKFVLPELKSIYFEKRWEQDIDDFHKEMNVVRLIRK